MTLHSLLAHTRDDPDFERLAEAAGPGSRLRAFTSSSLRPYLLAALIDRAPGQPALVVAADDRSARDLAADLRAFLAPRVVAFYPSRGVRYESHLAPPPHLVGLRVAALDELLSANEAGPVVVASAAALAEKVPDPALRPHAFQISKGDLLDLDEVAVELVDRGYQRVAQVEDRGQFSIRGDILDVYPATEERAVRCELFDVAVERLAFFSTFTQRSLEEVERVTIAPSAELGSEHRELAEIAALDDSSERPDIAELLPLERFRELLALVPEGTLVALAHEEELEASLTDHFADVSASLHDSEFTALYVPPDRLIAELERRAAVSLSGISGDQPFAFRAQGTTPTARSLREAESELEKLVSSGYTAVVAWTRRGEAERARYNLQRVDARLLDGGSSAREPGLVFAAAPLRQGFVAPALKLAVIPEHRLLRRRAERPGPRSGALASFLDLRPGDAVVHSEHGIARFAGFETKTVGGITRDYLELEYRDGDRVFVPAEQLDRVSRYVGADAGDPPLSKLGGKAWEQMKLRARRAAQALAGELLNLYAERKRRAGHAFASDGEWQLEFEQAFPYSETPDQLEAIEQVKADMEEARPMDRLICGDVGYGKTEVALRAAFKAAADGKQVMFLVPTTVLAQQHYGTFSERLRDYPFTIEVASRFRSQRQVRDALTAFADGRVDILIGTHRLLSRDVRPKDLGLLIVDEEQRFGVKQKELLRQLRLRVDVLSLSATPIPRTLQMSLAGLRDISVIETPPEGRRPVRTYVGEYDEDLVRQAIDRERARGGQAFFLHNRVETIDETAELVRAIAPQARIGVAHGQMDERALERSMLEFLRGELDVLVCTTIVEAGLDIPSANTLIVERADQLGLAQLYQIRGRVGRSRERAYAYLFFPSAAGLTSESAARLATLSDYTELGSGFKIAMRDLELRGAGNLLGDEQSGHVAAVGFELYMGMIDHAVAALSGTAADEPAEPVRIDVPADAYVPAEYVSYEAAKIELHRRVAAAREIADLILLREELEDRFGPLPEPLDNLIVLQDARIKLGAAGARAVTLRARRLAVTPIDLDPAGARLLRERLPEAELDSGRSTIGVAMGSAQGPELLRAIVGAAEAILEAAGAVGD